MATRVNPALNQSEAGSPITSAYGEAFRARLLPDAVDGGHPTYLPYRRIGIPGRYGDAGNVDSVAIPVTHRRGYAGLAPLELQPEVHVPPPWLTGG